MVTAVKVKGHFPKKGEKFINGQWVMPKPERTQETAADRRNWLRKQAGWPVKES